MILLLAYAKNMIGLPQNGPIMPTGAVSNIFEPP